MSVEPDVTPQLSDTFFGLTKAKAAGLFGLFALICTSVLTFLLVQHINSNADTLAQNRLALHYTCSTTQVLAGLVGFVVGQNEAALANKRLKLSPDQLAAIRATIIRFDQAQQLLRVNGACRAINKR